MIVRESRRSCTQTCAFLREAGPEHSPIFQRLRTEAQKAALLTYSKGD